MAISDLMSNEYMIIKVTVSYIEHDNLDTTIVLE